MNPNRSKRSPLWKFFEVSKDDPKFAQCLVCKSKLSRGGEGKRAGTSAMKNHLKNKHAKEYSEIFTSDMIQPEPVPSTSGKVVTTQACPSTLEELQKAICLNINDAKSKEYHYLIAEMIALDNEPLSIVERVGFVRLLKRALPNYSIPSRMYITETIIPDIYERIYAKIEANISKTSVVSVTSDIWSSTRDNLRFIRLTAHWLSPDLKLNHAVLAVNPFYGPHTGENISKELNAIATRWNIPESKIHLLVHDSGVNMIKDARLSNYQSARCFIHTLQLTMNDSLHSHVGVTEMIVAARGVVTHVNHSEASQEKFRTIQNELNLLQHELVLDVNTRYNSTFYLFERLLEQRRAVCLYLSNNACDVNNLTPEQWDLMEQTLTLLKPFEEITNIANSSCSCISEVIPHVATLLRYLEKEETRQKSNSMLQFIALLKDGIKKRLNVDDNPNYSIATVLDPRFKTSFLGTLQAEKARQKILMDILKMSSDEGSCSSRGEADSSPPSKKFRTAQSSRKHYSVWDCFNEVAEENSSNVQNIAEKNAIATELDYYLKAPRCDRNSDPYAWWSLNFKQFSNLAKLVKIYLSSPCSSVHNGRPFSEADNILYEDKTTRLLPMTSEKLVFIRHNLPLINFTY